MANESRSSAAAWRAGALVLTVAAALWSFPVAAVGAPGPGYQCLGSVGGRHLDGPTNVGVPGESTQGDAAGSWLISCSYPDAGNTWAYEVAWTPPHGTEPTFEGCGSKPIDPTSTWVSAARFAYASANNNSIPSVVAAAQEQLVVVEKLAKLCAAPSTTTTRAPTTTVERSAAIATVTGVVGDVAVMFKGTTTFVPLTRDAVLHVGDSISTDVDAQATLNLPWGQVTVSELSQIRINEIFLGADLTRLQLLLRTGRVETTIPETSLIRTDFSVKTPVSVNAIRGSAMVVTVTASGATTVHTTQDEAFVQGTSDTAPVVVPEGQMSTVGTDGVASSPVPFSASSKAEARSTSETPAESSSALVGIVIALVAIAIAGAVVVTTRGRVRLR